MKGWAGVPSKQAATGTKIRKPMKWRCGRFPPSRWVVGPSSIVMGSSCPVLPVFLAFRSYLSCLWAAFTPSPPGVGVNNRDQKLLKGTERGMCWSWTLFQVSHVATQSDGMVHADPTV